MRILIAFVLIGVLVAGCETGDGDDQDAIESARTGLAPTRPEVTPTEVTPPESARVPTATADTAPSPAHDTRIPAQVIRVVDGDTLEVSLDGQQQTVRIIGVDTPETVDPNSPVMCYGVEATAQTQDLVDRASGQVLLEKDVSETDQYDRLLRYVWLLHPDGQRMLNQELVTWGFAQASTYPPDVKYQELFSTAQREAREQGRGLWETCGEFGVPAATPTPVPTPMPEPTPTPIPPEPTPIPPQPTAPPAPAPSGNCDPAYPDVCIAPKSQVGDLDCGDIPYGRFRVLPPDPHGFDGNDNDGLGCESN